MTKSAKHPVRSLLINALLMALAFGLLGMAIWNNRDQIRDVFRHSLDGRLLALAFAIYMVGMITTFVRWFFLVRVVEPQFRLTAAGLLGFIGNLFNLVIPGAVGGDLIKAAYLVRMQVKRTQAIASMVIDRILGLLGLFILAAVAGAVAWPVASGNVHRLTLVVWGAVAAGFIGLTLIFTQGLSRRFPGLLAGHSKRAMILRELNVMSSTYRSRLGVVAGALAMASCNHAMFVVAFYLVSRTLFPDMATTLGQHFLMVPLTLFTTAVPLPFGALGLSEKVSQELFKLVQHPAGDLAMIGFRVLMYGGGLVCAAVYLANLRQARGLTADAEHLEEEIADGTLDEPGLAPEPACIVPVSTDNGGMREDGDA